MTRLKQEVLDVMISDPDLYCAIAKAKGVAPGSVHTIISRNGKSINEYGILKLVAEYLGRDIDSLVEKVDDKSNTMAA